jgi:sulfotransferase
MVSTGFIGVSGLPRSGSTLLCQLLAEHPDIHCEGHSSPLCNALLNTRRSISDDAFFLSQLDVQFDRTYQHLQAAMSGFLKHWYHDCQKPWVADKNRAWLHCIEMLLQLDPNARLLVNIRELGQVYGSIEAQHQRTILVDFVDHLADYDRYNRAIQLFSPGKTVGTPLASIRAVQNLPVAIRDRLYFVKFEHLVSDPVTCMNHVFEWLGLAPHTIDPGHLTMTPQESDSHYRYKFSHRRNPQMMPPVPHAIPPAIQQQLESTHAWYYQAFYPK